MSASAAQLSSRRSLLSEKLFRARTLHALWIAGILAVYCLHFPHLLADFPNNSPWIADYAKYTDEGWYANAAVRWHLTGHWYLRGDFNPAVALPVWPALLALIFHFTGVSLAAARATALVLCGINLLLSYSILRTQAPRWVALLAVTLLVSSPFLFAFSRLAILEPLLMTLFLLSWRIALHLPHAAARVQSLLLVVIGVLLCLMILTKTTAIFIIPSTLFLVAHAFRFRLAASRALVISLTTTAFVWGVWYFLFVAPRYRIDYHYLFAANDWPQPTTFSGWLFAFWYALHGTLWISPTLCLTALGLLVLSLWLALSRRSGPGSAPGTGPRSDPGSRPPSVAFNPIVPASLLLGTGYIFFAGWHNSPQPRYYETVVYALCFVLALAAANLLHPLRSLLFRSAGIASLVVMAIVAIAGIFHIAAWIRHPEYTFVNAARSVARTIEQNPGQHRLLLSISGDEITLITHIPAICDDYGTWDVPYRIHTYQPGWYAAWNELDAGTLEDIHTQDALEPVARFTAFDDPDRDVLILYRIVLLPAGRQSYDARQEALDNAGK